MKFLLWGVIKRKLGRGVICEYWYYKFPLLLSAGGSLKLPALGNHIYIFDSFKGKTIQIVKGINYYTRRFSWPTSTLLLAPAEG